MRKIASGLLILVFLLPVIGIFCYCCPTASAAPSNLEISAPDCSCCHTEEFRRDQGVFGRLENFISTFLQNLFLQTVSASSVSTFETLANPDFRQASLGPPGFSHAPLYLATQVLRI